MAENYEIKIDTVGLVVGVKAATAALSGLGRVLGSISEAVAEAFSVRGYADYLSTVKRFGKHLADELLVLQLNFGRMKAAIADAAAPIAAVLVPWLNTAVRAVTDFADALGAILGGVMAGVSGNDALADSARNAAQAEETLESAATSAGKAARRSLMGFDQINRLNAGSGGGSASSSGSASVSGPVQEALSPQLQAVVDQILALLEPLRQIDFSPLRASLQGLWTAFQTLAEIVGGALEWLWYEVLAPFLAWLAEEFAPAFADTWAGALTLAAAVIEPVVAGLQSLYAAMEPVVGYIGESAVLALERWQEAFETLAAVFQEKGPQITGILTNIGTVFSALWGLVQPILTSLREGFGATFDTIWENVSIVVGAVTDALYGLTEYLAGVFTGDWKRSWNGIVLFLKGLVNGVIGLLNAMLSRLGSALNSVIRAANKLNFTVPDWVPGLGGSRFGLNMGYVTVPQIPYLAQGAVLPANKPFLAVVGDQHSGTNVEAPLSTIQAAVAAVMADMAEANLAGQEAIVGVLRQILEAVLGIHIGDGDIAQAVTRYQQKLNIARGTGVY